MNRHQLIAALFCISITASGFPAADIAQAARADRSLAGSAVLPEGSTIWAAEPATIMTAVSPTADMLLAQKIVKQSSKSGKSVKQTIANQLKAPKKQKVSPSKAKQQKTV